MAVLGRGRRHRVGVAVVLVAAVVGSAACAVLPQPVPLRGEPAPGPNGAVERPPCAEAAVRSCALPYPSDEFVVADPSTATGRRLRVPPELLPAGVRAALGPGARPEDVFADADGFSPVGPVVFELDRAVRPESLPPDGGDVAAVFDAATGARVPIRAELSTDALRQGAPNTIVELWPLTRWEPGRTYLARLTDGLAAYLGRPQPAPGMRDPGPYLRSVRTDLARVEGDRWASLLSATRFSVRSRQNAAGDLERMAALARRQPHRIRNLDVVPPLLVPGAAAVVSGEVELTDFRDAAGVADPDHPPAPSWERFLLVVPERPAGPAGAPVAVYGHGLTVAKETMVAVASTNARLGVATIGIDVPNHGDRQADEGGYLLDLTDPALFGRLASMPLQGIVDLVSLVQAVRTSMATLDRSPWRPDGLHGDGLADLDIDRILYQGTSMGGVLGVAAVALLPELAGGYVQVAGSGIADIITHSLLWPLFAPIIPDGATAGDAAALRAAATLLLDRADNTHLVERLRDAGPPLFVQYGVGDAVVPNVTTDRLLHLADLPLVGPDLTRTAVPVRRLPVEGVPDDGRGAVQVWAMNSSTELLPFLAHVSFAEPEAQRWLEAWLVNRLSALGVASPPG
jgi:hypothetical protein